MSIGSALLKGQRRELALKRSSPPKKKKKKFTLTAREKLLIQSLRRKR